MRLTGNDMIPRVSVLMSVYNGELFLADSVDSVLAQDFTDFELIIIDDGSTDLTAEVLSKYTDPRIRVISNQVNIGVARSINKGLKLARGEYIARMDSDDICFSHRLRVQVDFLDKHPDIFLCGAWMSPMHQPSIVWKTPVKHNEIACRLLFENCINQPTVIMRSERVSNISNQYDSDIQQTEDYDLWERLIWDEQVKFAVIPEALVLYRIHSQSCGQRVCDLQQAVADEVRVRQIKRLGISPAKDEVLLHRAIARGCPTLKNWNVFERVHWLLRLVTANIFSCQYSQLLFLKEVVKHLRISLNVRKGFFRVASAQTR